MEQQNNEVTSQQGSDDLHGMYAAYKKTKETKKPLTKEEKLAKFFVPRRDKEIFRTLPPLNRDSTIPLGDRLFEKAYFHEVKAGKKYRKVYCPAHNDPKVQAKDPQGNLVFDQNNNPVMVSSPCPMCKKAKALLATQDRSLIAKTKGVKKEQLEQILTPAEKQIVEKNKKIYTDASKIEAKKFYILRGIDRGLEKDGVKFWRFKHDFRNKGTYDKLMAVTEEYVLEHGNFFDTIKGTDFTILMQDAQMPGKSYTYRDINTILTRGQSKLHVDPLIEKQWLEDKTVWKDVFKPVTAPKIDAHKFLELAAEDLRDNTGNVIGTCAPYYEDSDPTNKRWIIPNHPELEAEVNRRDDNLDADNDYYEEENEYASAASNVVSDNNAPKQDINTITNSDVKPFNHGAETIATTKQQPQEAYDDLPF